MRNISPDLTETAGGGWLGFDDVTIVTSVVPEPSAALLGVLGLMVLLRRRV